MEKRGIATERGNLNREIEVSNDQLRQLHTRISKIKKEISSVEVLRRSAEVIMQDVPAVERGQINTQAQRDR